MSRSLFLTIGMSMTIVGLLGYLGLDAFSKHPKPVTFEQGTTDSSIQVVSDLIEKAEKHPSNTSIVNQLRPMKQLETRLKEMEKSRKSPEEISSEFNSAIKSIEILQADIFTESIPAKLVCFDNEKFDPTLKPKFNSYLIKKAQLRVAQANSTNLPEKDKYTKLLLLNSESNPIDPESLCNR